MEKISLRKKIKKYGNSAVLILSPEDMDVYGWKIGDYLDLSDIVKVKYKKLPKSDNLEVDIKKEVKNK
jgi:hypothetical protein